MAAPRGTLQCQVVRRLSPRRPNSSEVCTRARVCGATRRACVDPQRLLGVRVSLCLLLGGAFGVLAPRTPQVRSTYASLVDDRKDARAASAALGGFYVRRHRRKPCAQPLCLSIYVTHAIHDYVGGETCESRPRSVLVYCGLKLTRATASRERLLPRRETTRRLARATLLGQTRRLIARAQKKPTPRRQ